MECLLKILDNLEYRDLLEVVQTSHNFRILARDVFRRKMPSSLEIYAPFSEINSQSFNKYSTLLEVYTYEMTELTIRLFGDQIKNIDLTTARASQEERRQIHQLIDKYCSDSLISLIFVNSVEESLTFFNAPLKKVESLKVHGEMKLAKNGLRLNEIFPGLRQFVLYGSDNKIHDLELLNVTFPLLTRVSLRISNAQQSYPYIEKFIKRNSQIQDLTLDYINSFDYLRLVSEYLPYLEHLKLSMGFIDTSGDQFTGEKINFGHVKTVSMQWGQNDLSRVMEFDQLELLHLQCFGKEGVRFATQFPSLKQLLLISDPMALDNDDILSLGEKLPHLKELCILNELSLEKETVVQLIEGIEVLETLRLKLTDEFDFQGLIDHFSTHWLVTVNYNQNDIFMRRK